MIGFYHSKELQVQIWVIFKSQFAKCTLLMLQDVQKLTFKIMCGVIYFLRLMLIIKLFSGCSVTDKYVIAIADN